MGAVSDLWRVCISIGFATYMLWVESMLLPPRSRSRCWIGRTRRRPRTRRNARIRRRRINRLRPHQHRNHGPRHQAKLLMPNSAQDRAKGAGVARKGDVGAVVVAEDVVEEELEAGFLSGVGFAQVGLPKGVVLWEAGLEGVGGVGGMDVGP